MLAKYLRRWRLRQIKRAGLQIAADCHLGGWPVWGSEPFLISIGRRVAISDGAVFLTHDGGTWVFRNDEGFEDVIKFGRITIHDGCFIGYGVTFMPGVEVGPNSVIAAGSVVTRSIPANSVAAGNPARVFMSRDEYARQSKLGTVDYDREAYQRDKRAELLRIYPRPW